MKKQFQILSIAITIIFLSCGKHNAEIKSTIKTEAKEISKNSCLLTNETDLFLIDTEGELRLNADTENRTKSFRNLLREQRPLTLLTEAGLQILLPD